MSFPFREEPITPEEHELIRQASGALHDRCEQAVGTSEEDQFEAEHDAMMRLRRRNDQVEKDLVAVTEERDRIERNRDMWKGQVERQASALDSMRGEFIDSVEECARLRATLEACEDYFDQRADADCDQDGYIPNEEMKLLQIVREALGKAGAA